MTRLSGAAALILGNPTDADQHTFDAMAQHFHGDPRPGTCDAVQAAKARRDAASMDRLAARLASEHTSAEIHRLIGALLDRMAAREGDVDKIRRAGL